MLYAQREINSGEMKEIEIYPIQPNGRLLPGSLPKTSGTSEAQAKYNKKMAILRAVRRINANFGERDLFFSATVEDEYPGMPQTEAEARALIKKYFRILRKYRRENGLPELRYGYVIHAEERKTGKLKGRTVYHYHLFMSGMDRDVAEALWPGGEGCRALRFQPWRFGQEAAGRYMGKSARGVHRYVFSRSCVYPEICEPVRRRVSRERIRSMAEDHIDDAAFWESFVPEGYVFRGADAVWNERNARYYIRATFRLMRGGGNSARFA